MRARRDDVRAVMKAVEAGNNAARALKTTRSVPGIYARFDELGHEELQVLANRYQAGSQTQLNQRGKYHARYMRDAYPIAGSQFKLEKERKMEVAAKKKLLLTDASSMLERNTYSSERKGGVLSLGLDRLHERSKLEHYMGKLTTTLKGEQEQVKQTMADRQVRLAEVRHREGMEQFWRLMHSAPKR
ncbi:unnamed protein product [Phytophthora lilii]|uniref:Unnamed protein product n=1 Tax=Phytophthora lilii TaxID=2077276 RepID=A0A9W6T9A0_9STRA|nr:unnamed protein product [Phytophthora lilii]